MMSLNRYDKPPVNVRFAQVAGTPSDDKPLDAHTVVVTPRDDDSLPGAIKVVTPPARRRVRYGMWKSFYDRPVKPHPIYAGLTADGKPIFRTVEPTLITDTRRSAGRRRYEEKCAGCGGWFPERPASVREHCAPCGACGVVYKPRGRQRYCNQACRQKAYRRRKAG